MPEPVGCSEVIFRRTGCNSADNLFQALVIGKGKKHRFDICIIDAHMLHAVIFLVAAGKLMLFNTIHIIVNIGSNYNTILGTPVHCLRVYIIMVAIVLHQPSLFTERTEILHSLVINLRVMLVGSGFEIDFRLYYMI